MTTKTAAAKSTKPAAPKKTAAKSATKPTVVHETAPATAQVSPDLAAPEAKAQATAKTPKAKPATSPSTVESPVALVHATCDKMSKANPKLARKDVMQALAGKVNKHTISTQWQRWNSARKVAQ